MSEQIQQKIISHLKSDRYRPQKPRGLAQELNLAGEEDYHTFRDALKELMRQGRVVAGGRGAIVLPSERQGRDTFIGTYRQNKRGFGFVIPRDPAAREDLYIPEGENGGAITGDVVRATITSRGQRDGKPMYTGRIVEILERRHKRFAGTLTKQGTQWFVMPDGNTFTSPIRTPDAASKHIRPGTKVIVEITEYPEAGATAAGVIIEVLGEAGEKDVDLRSIIVQYNLPEEFPDDARDQASAALQLFNAEQERQRRLDLTDEVICTIDPDDAKDYDDAISLRQAEHGYWELGVHIADVSHFIPAESALDVEAKDRGNSTYFPGFVIPMLPEVLSNGVCSLQEAVPRLCKSAFITLDDDARPIRTRFANTIIKSRKRLTYTEAQGIIDNADVVKHRDEVRRLTDYPDEVVQLLRDMNALAKRIQKRRRAEGQLVLNLPRVELVLDEDGKVIDAVPEDQSFTHTLIEMFMVEANEAVARLLDSLDVPFLRRVHPDPEVQDSERLRHFASVTGYRLPKDMDRKALQALLESVRGKPEAFAINLAVLKSLTRAEYSPEAVGHFALASEHYCHFTSPIRRYADLTIHRLLDAYFAATTSVHSRGPTDRARGGRRGKVVLDDVPSYDELVELGKHISFTERRSEDAERELRQVKILELMQHHIGDEFPGVVTGITNFGIFVQLEKYLVDGLIRYEDLMDDWWDVDEKSGVVRGQHTGTTIKIGDVVRARIVRVDLPRRELDLAILEVRGRGRNKAAAPLPAQQGDQQQRVDGGGASKRPKPASKHQKHRQKFRKQSQHRAGGAPPAGQPHAGGGRRNEQTKRARRGRRGGR